jgi:hypothetical protein
MKVQAEFQVTKWEEAAVPGLPIARASVAFQANGEINGLFTVEYLMHYTSQDGADAHNSVVTYFGFLQFNGEIGARSGAFILEDRGHYENSAPHSELTVKAGTGSGDFIDVTGDGRYYADGERMIMELTLTP